MSFIDFLKTKVVYIFSFLIAICIIEFYLVLYRANGFICLLPIFCIGVALLVSVIVEYEYKKKYYNRLKTIINGIDKKYLFTEIIDLPTTLEEKIFNEAFRELNSNMIEEINNYKEEIIEYKEYIEMWVHEVKTPLSTAKLITENNKNEIIESIEDELTKIDKYITQCLYHSKIDSVNEDYIIQNTNINKIIKKVIKDNKKALIQNKFSIKIEQEEYNVKTDEKWIEFIMNQIISNSIKYKSKNPELNFSIEKNKENIILSISDNGIGIKEDELKKVFKKGFTGTNGRKKEASTGMGLYISKRLADKLGCKLCISSEEKKGTKLDIIFPINSMFSELE